MKINENTGTVKMNLTFPKEFAQLLEQKANNSYMPLATLVKSYLMTQLLQDGDNLNKQSINEDGTEK